MNKIDLSLGKVFPYGASTTGEGVQFCLSYPEKSRVILKIHNEQGKNICNINMNDYHVSGNVHSVIVSGINADNVSYNYTRDGEYIRDPYAMKLKSRYKWGDFKRNARGDGCMVYDPSYDWEGDKPLRLPFNKVIGYMLHVRGFTRHTSSGVKGKGTFMGINEKTDYLKELGITQIELMPAYDFTECEVLKDYRSNSIDEDGNNTLTEHRINYWGFKEGSYFVPKPQYAFSGDSVKEFKDMVKALHKAGIEVVMQFYFPSNVNRNLITDCLRFWVREYHIDGFHIYGSRLPLDVLATDPALTQTKLYYERYDADGIFSADSCVNTFLAEYNQDYVVDVRRFLKSDEDMLHKFLFRQRCNPDRIKVINHLTSYDGFTLNDLVSYDYKHNEANGEDNKDGTGYNYSWNCGVEGSTRKNAILKLRMKQLKNAFCLLMLSQGTPMFMAGDEFMNSQGGNNNPYCQDNEVTWLNWKRNKRSTELYEYVKSLIALRRSHPVLRMEKEATLLDNRSCGYPDISYHSENAWYPQMDTHIRHVGILLCGYYAGEGKADDFFYMATNMHWEDHFFAMPKLPKDVEWTYCTDTDTGSDRYYPVMLDDNGNKQVRVPARTVLLFRSRKKRTLTKK